MKKALLLLAVTASLVSCKQTTPPKDVAVQFIKAVYTGDGTTAASLTTAATQTTVAALKPQQPSVPAEESFSLSTLSETTNSNTATVKNAAINLTLQKDSDGWRVAASPETVAAISNRPAALAAAKAAWETLSREYKSRLLVAKDFVQYKKGHGVLSPPLQNLEAMVNRLLAETDAGNQPVAANAAAQNALEDLLDKAYEPSFTTNADISMNYLLQLNSAADRIKEAKRRYNEAVAKAPTEAYPSVQ